MKYLHKKGFTLIELLVVISIISLLSSIVLASVNGARMSARDARRALDMDEIYKAVNLYYDQYGYLPVTSSYGETNCGGWDYSSQTGGSSGSGASCVSTPGTTFMTFLKTAGFMSQVPVDPVNNMTGDRSNTGYAYAYYCYPPTNYGGGLHLSYISEKTGQIVVKNPNNTLDYNNQPDPTVHWTDTTYVCK